MDPARERRVDRCFCLFAHVCAHGRSVTRLYQVPVAAVMKCEFSSLKQHRFLPRSFHGSEPGHSCCCVCLEVVSLVPWDETRVSTRLCSLLEALRQIERRPHSMLAGSREWSSGSRRRVPWLLGPFLPLQSQRQWAGPLRALTTLPPLPLLFLFCDCTGPTRLSQDQLLVLKSADQQT